MTYFLNHYTLKYTPLSPLHIGADESYEPGNYVIDDEAGALYSFDNQAAMAGLSDSDKQHLLAIVNGKPDDSMLTKVQAFFHNHREKLLAFANSPIPTASGIKALYEKRIGKTAQNEGHGKRVINKLEIERTFYNPVNSKPLLPGSSIKGAIRTALLDGLNQGKPLERGEKYKYLQERLLEGKFATDPLRLVSIGDAEWHGKADKPACKIQFAVNRKRKPVMRNGKLVQSQAEASNLYQLLECVAPNHYQGFSGSLTLHNTQSIRQDDCKLPKQHLHWTVKDIANACNRFYRDLFLQELNAMKARNYLKLDWLEQMEQLLEQLNADNVFLLRVGRHSGAEALTLNKIRSIKIMQGKRERPKYEDKPLTWWFAADEITNKQALLPFGWVLVEIDAKSRDQKVQQWLENNHNELTAWMQAQLNRQSELKQQADLRKRQEQEKRLAEQQREEEDRIKQKAEQQRLANLSPIEQEIEIFLKSFQVQEHDTRLLQELEKGRWQAEDAQIVAQKVKALMEQTGKWMPDFTGTNKTKVKMKTRSEKVLQYLE